MQPNQDQDEEFRLDAKVRVRLDLRDIATFFVNSMMLDFTDGDDIV